MSEWNEVRRGIPPEELDVVPDGAIDYEVWTTMVKSLILYSCDDPEFSSFYLVKTGKTMDDVELIGEYPNYTEAKEQLEDTKDEYR